MVRLDIDGLGELTLRVNRAGRLVVDLSSNKVEASAQRIVFRAIAFAPHRTGALRSSIAFTMSSGRTKAYVGVTAGPKGERGVGPEVYWRFVEFGTSRVPARPFFRPAAEGEHGAYLSAMTRMGRELEARV